MKEELPRKKLTLEEYQQKNSNPENIKAAQSFMFILSAVIGVIIGTALFFVVLKLFDIHEIAGYVGIVASFFIFIFAYVVPLVKLKNTKSFITRVDRENARKAQKYNKALREEIADKMIEISQNIEDVEWYSKENVDRLAIALRTRNDKGLKSVLTEIYKTDVNKSAKKMIRSSAMRVGFTTAASQSEIVDTLFIVIFQLNLIKDIVYLYGYRPTDAQMARIYKNVVRNALLAYGVSNVSGQLGRSIGGGLVGKALDRGAASGNLALSAVGTLLGVVVDSGVQFVVNSTLTTLIGYQTQKYLVKEYNLQDILDDIEIIDSEVEAAQEIEAINKEIKAAVKKAQKSKEPKAAPA